MKLGRKPYISSKKDLIYKNYRGASLPPAPPSFGHQSLVSTWGMLANDSLGDCVIAGAMHAAMLWTTEGGKPAAFTPANAISDYSAACGYIPGKPSSDQGCYVRNVLDYQRTVGMVDSSGIRHKIGAFLALDLANLTEVLEAIYLFSVVKIGFNFPSSAMSQFNSGQPWTVVPGSTIQGGHDVEIIGYDADWLYVITWGKVQKMSFEFFKTYCDEAWAALSVEMLNGQGLSPEGFNLSQLQADLAALPNVPPVPVPPKVYTLKITTDKPSYNTNQLITLTISTSEPNQPVSLVITQPDKTSSPTWSTDATGNLTEPFVESSGGVFTVSGTWIDPNGVAQKASVSAVIVAPVPPVPPAPPAPEPPKKLIHVQSNPYLDIEEAKARVAYYASKGRKVYLVHLLQFDAFSSTPNAENEQADLLKTENEITHLAEY